MSKQKFKSICWIFLSKHRWKWIYLEEVKEEEFGQKEYMSKMNMHDARLYFRIRTRSIKCKMNQPSDRHNKETLWKCTACGNIDSQKHIMWCPAFKEIREGRSLESDNDLVNYFRQVLIIRDKLDLWNDSTGIKFGVGIVNWSLTGTSRSPGGKM